MMTHFYLSTDMAFIPSFSNESSLVLIVGIFVTITVNFTSSYCKVQCRCYEETRTQQRPGEETPLSPYSGIWGFESLGSTGNVVISFLIFISAKAEFSTPFPFPGGEVDTCPCSFLCCGYEAPHRHLPQSSSSDSRFVKFPLTTTFFVKHTCV